MKEQKLSKGELRRIEAEKKAKKKRLIYTLVCTAICIAFIAIIIVLHNDSNKAKDKETNQNTQTEVVSKAEHYSKGLDKEGKIDGITDISSYVTLPDDLELVAYAGDYTEEKTPNGIIKNPKEVQMGSHLLDIIVFYSEVNVYSEYYNTMKELYTFIYNDQYETYSKIYENNGAMTWDSLYDFLGVSEKEYYKILEKNSMNDTIHYLVVQALVEKYGITCNEEDKLAYCKSSDTSILNDEDAKKLISIYGDEYITQRTLEWKLKYALVEKAQIVDGSLTDDLESQASLFEATYYDNGKIRGLGDLTPYITIADYKAYIGDCSSGRFLLDKIIDNSEFSLYQEYLNNKEKELMETVMFEADGTDLDGDYGKMAESEFYRDITVQKLFTEFGLELEDYYEAFCKHNLMDPDEETVQRFIWGEGWFNRRVMEYAVIDYLDGLIAEN